MNKIIWSPKAVAGLEQLISFLDHQWETKVGDNLLKEIDAATERISKDPLQFPVYSKKKGIRKCLIKKRTLLFYKIIEREIHIVLLVDARQNPKKFLL